MAPSSPTSPSTAQSDLSTAAGGGGDGGRIRLSPHRIPKTIPDRSVFDRCPKWPTEGAKMWHFRWCSPLCALRMGSRAVCGSHQPPRNCTNRSKSSKRRDVSVRDVLLWVWVHPPRVQDPRLSLSSYNPVSLKKEMSMERKEKRIDAAPPSRSPPSAGRGPCLSAGAHLAHGTWEQGGQGRDHVRSGCITS